MTTIELGDTRIALTLSSVMKKNTVRPSSAHEPYIASGFPMSSSIAGDGEIVAAIELQRQAAAGNTELTVGAAARHSAKPWANQPNDICLYEPAT